MDRRQFLKLTGAAAAASVISPATELSAARKKGRTPLETKGYVKEPARQIPIVDSADVVVLGGGPAGFAAAVSAAREGVDVMMIEREYFLGGLFTGCGVTPIINMYNYSPAGREQAVVGIADELCNKLHAVGLTSRLPGYIRYRVDPEAAKYFMEEISDAAGVRMLYGVHATQVLQSGDAIRTVIIEGKSGRVAINCKFVVDCTGDGDVLEWTGEDFEIRKNDIGAMWRLGNATGAPKGTPTCTKGVVGRHMTGPRNQDGLDIYNLTRIQKEIRKTIWDEAQAFRKMDGLQDLFIVDTPSVVGVRVTRVLNGVEKVLSDDAAVGKAYKNVIGMAGGETTLTYSGGKIPMKERKMWQVPYGALCPKTVPNLLVGGRCFSFDKGITYDAREVGTCFMTGQAAGVAAALAVISRCSCRDVDIPTLQKRLKAQNVKL